MGEIKVYTLAQLLLNLPKLSKKTVDSALNILYHEGGLSEEIVEAISILHQKLLEYCDGNSYYCGNCWDHRIFRRGHEGNLYCEDCDWKRTK